MSAAAMFFGFAILLVVLIGTNGYIALRIYQGVKYIIPQIGAAIFFIIGLFLVIPFIFGFLRSQLPLPPSVKNTLGVISSYWMGIFLYLLFYFVVADAVILLLRITKVMSGPVPQNTYIISGLLVILATIVTVGYGLYNAGRIKHVYYEIILEEKIMPSELKIALISDLHLGALKSEKRLGKIVRDINDLEPDIVCITGDIFDNDFYAIHNPNEAKNLLKSIKSRYGVYACLGNHDAGKTINKMLNFLKRSNIRVLNDEYVVIDDRVVLVGRLDPSPIGGFGDMKRKDMEDVITGVDKSFPVIVMDHNPANIGEYENKADLVLSGHTHRGQVFPGNLVTWAMYVVDYGYYRKDSSNPHVIVTSGAGTWGLPMRVGSNCEIVSIKLR